MTEEEFELLFVAISAMIDERISSALGRDSLSEAIRASEAFERAKKVIVYKEVLNA